MTKKLTGRGGPGRGQGRKPKPPQQKYKSIHLKLPPDLIEWMAANVSTGKRNEFIEQSIRARVERIEIE